MNTKIIESYIVRIYRRDESKCKDFVGIIEDPGSTGTMSFKSKEELLDILGNKMNRPKPANKERRYREFEKKIE